MASEPEIPSTIEQALKSNARAKWKEAIDAELNSIKEFNVWKLVQRTNQNWYQVAVQGQKGLR